MKRTLIISAITLAWSLGLMSSETNAQSCPHPGGCIYGTATVTINYQASRVEGYSYAQADYTAGLNFNPHIQGSIYRTDNPEIDLDFRTSTGNGSSVPAVINLSTTNFVNGKTYCNYTNYFAIHRSTGQTSFIGFIQDCKTISVSPPPTPTPTPTPTPCVPFGGEPCPTPTPSPTPTPEPSPTVSISAIDVVEKFGMKDVSITVANNASGITRFTLATIAGTGMATFENGTNEIIVNGNVTNQPLKIKGVTESSQVDNLRIEAKVNDDSTVLASDDFTVAFISSLSFEKFDSDYTDIDTNPGNGQPNSAVGERIFPGKLTLTLPTQKIGRW